MSRARSTNDAVPERIANLERWLSSVLEEPSFTITPASDDASFRRYFRVTQRSRRHTFIVMDAPPEHEDCRPFVTVAARLEQAGIHVPRVHAHDFEAGFLLLDDLGTQCYLDLLDDTTADALYRDAIRALIEMQSKATQGALEPYDDALLRKEIALFSDWFLTEHLAIDVGPSSREVIARAANGLCEACLAQPRVFVHRDYHSRNLMYRPERNPGVIDFQDAVHGPIAYDVVSLFRDVYIAWPEHRVDDWVGLYWRDAVAAGLLESTSLAEFKRWFDLTGAQRHLKIAGIFSRLYHRDGKARYLFDIPLALTYLADVCGRYPSLEPLGALIEEFDLIAQTRKANAEVEAHLADAASQ